MNPTVGGRPQTPFEVTKTSPHTAEQAQVAARELETKTQSEATKELPSVQNKSTLASWTSKLASLAVGISFPIVSVGACLFGIYQQYSKATAGGQTAGTSSTSNSINANATTADSAAINNAANISILKVLSSALHQAYQDVSLKAKTNLNSSKMTEFSQRMIDLIRSATSSIVSRAIGDESDKLKALAPRGRSQYESISHELKDEKGQTVGTEQVDRVATNTILANSLRAEIAFLSKSPNTNNEARIKRCQEKLESLKGCDTWTDPNLSRELFNRYGFTRGIKQLVSGACNLRIQSMEIGDTKLSFLRFGIVWDARNGLTSLKELNELKKDFDACAAGKSSRGEFNTAILNRLAKLDALPAKTADEKAAIAHCKEQLQSFLFKTPNEFPSFDKINFINHFIDDRESALLDQMLGPVLMNMRDQYKGGGELKMFHLGLLNPIASTDFQKNGWAHSEPNQIGDMQAVMERLNGCTIKVRERGNPDNPDNPTGSFFHKGDDGKLTLYLDPADLDIKDGSGTKECGLKAGEKITLQTIFMNISVQDKPTTKPKNEGVQQEINKNGIEELDKWIKILPDNSKKTELQDKLTEIKARLEPAPPTVGESSFDLASELLLIASEFAAISEGCLSCKDRGGTVAEMVVIKALKQASKVDEKQMKKLLGEIFSSKSPCLKVIADCTGVLNAKVNYILLPIAKSVALSESVKVAFAAISGSLVSKPPAPPHVDVKAILDGIFPGIAPSKQGEIKKRLDAYAVACGIHPNQMYANIQNGKLVAQEIALGNLNGPFKTEDLRDFDWFMRAHQAKDDGNLYLKGIMVFPDPDGHFAAFIENVRGTYHGQDVAPYERLSSHYPEKARTRTMSKGIDASPRRGAPPMELAGEGNHTFLAIAFEENGTKVVALKNEGYSAAPITNTIHGSAIDRLVDNILHGLAWIQKKGPLSRFQTTSESTDSSYADRKEDQLPKDVAEALKKIDVDRLRDNAPEGNKTAVKEAYQNLKNSNQLGCDYGMQELHAYLSTLSSTDEDVKDVITKIEGYSKPESPIKPRGNEVIMPSIQELLSRPTPA
jgi:hypothetical protein